VENTIGEKVFLCIQQVSDNLFSSFVNSLIIS
jgi:hypothetical protein